MPDQVVIVGGGVAAMRCALELRERGFDGHLCMLCAESTPPYDRTLVSKALTSGDPVDADRLLLQSLESYDRPAIELRLGVRATALEAADRRLVLADGSRTAYDRVVLAVGGEPARPPRLMADGVVTLRELGDAQRLEPVLGAVGRVVIIGGGFIGSEVASVVVERGLDATIVDAALPFAPLLGERVARRICAMHRARGVTLLTGTPVDRVRRAGPAFRIDLADGRHVPADVVVVAVGMRPATRWLDRSALRANRGVPVDPGGRTEPTRSRSRTQRRRRASSPTTGAVGVSSASSPRAFRGRSGVRGANSTHAGKRRRQRVAQPPERVHGEREWAFPNLIEHAGGFPRPQPGRRHTGGWRPTDRRQRRAMSIHVDVDRDLCIGSGTCVRLAPGVSRSTRKRSWSS